MYRFFHLLLITLLLTGCAAQNPVPATVQDSSMEIVEQNAPFMELVEKTALGEQFCLPETVTGFLPAGKNLLFFSGKDSTILTLADPICQQVISDFETGIPLSPQNPSVQMLDVGVSYFNSTAGETVVLDHTLQEIHRISAPEGLRGVPLLSQGADALYYCTADAIRVLNLSTGIHRTLREAAYPTQELSGLILEDSVLEVSISESGDSRHTLFLSTATGQLLGDLAGEIHVQNHGSDYLLHVQEAMRKTTFFGRTGAEVSVLHPRKAVDNSFFLGSRILTTFRQDNAITMDLYQPDTGLRIASASLLPGETIVNAIETDYGELWILCRQADTRTVLYRWNPETAAVQDTTNYTSPRYTKQNPDYEGLAACSLLAQDISSRHGFEILVYTDAVEMQPPDYILDYEYDTAVLRRELELLDARLGNYPPGFLQTVSSKFSGIKIGIVRQIQSTPESGNVEISGGIQFWNGHEAYILLAAGHDTERTLYHELCHLIDTIVLTESTAYDQWDALNPIGFQYANTPTHSMSADNWRQAGWESFLDDDSLGYAKEDRATIMEYAMMPGNADRFESPYLQAKLKLLCTGLREAFGLEDSPQAFLWEQYLKVPLTHNP